MVNPSVPCISVVCLDNDYYVRERWRLELDAPEITLVASCQSEDELLDSVILHQPHVAIIDLHLGRHVDEGLDLVRSLKELAPEMRRIVLTGVDPNGDLFADALYAGAQAYYRKDKIPNHDLVGLVKRIAAGGCEYERELADEHMRRLRDHLFVAVRPDRQQQDPPLTTREQDVLALAAEGYRTEDIATRLRIAVPTVYTHINHIIDKFKVSNRDQAVIYAVLKGYLSTYRR